MKFVSKLQYSLGIRKATMRPEVTQQGVTTYVVANPALKAHFTARALTHAEIESARTQFLELQGPYAFGSIPGRDEGNINVQDALEEGYTGTAHQGYDVYQHFTVYDTADPAQCPPEDRAEAEEFLLNHYDLGKSYVRVDSYVLTLPWPTYPEEGEVNADKLVAFAKAAGLVEVVLTYERARAHRPNVVAAFEQAMLEDQAERSKEAGLTAQV